MRIKVLFRKNLKMSEGKLAAQVAHAVGRLLVHGKAGTYIDPDDWNLSIVVLEASDKKFDEISAEKDGYTQVDNGITEVERGTKTAFAYID